MGRLWAAVLATATLSVAFALNSPVFAADGEPTVHQIYEAAQAGKLDDAQQMMDKVLKDHPQSSKAHFVQAELFAKAGKTSQARAELLQAEQLKPGLPDESPRAVQALKVQLGMVPRTSQSPRVNGVPAVSSAPSAARFPWGMALVLVVAIGVLWMLFRRRNPPAQQYPGSGMPMGGGPMGGGPGAYAGPGGGYAGSGPVAGGGMGSSIAGGLASGLAVGAGVVAGEEIARHFIDGRGERVAAPPANNDGTWEPSNTDMGGTDFGVNDAGSWDDSGGGGGGGGDDWT